LSRVSTASRRNRILRRYDLVVRDPHRKILFQKSLEPMLYRYAYAKAYSLCVEWAQQCDEVEMVEYRPGRTTGIVVDAVRARCLEEEPCWAAPSQIKRLKSALKTAHAAMSLDTG
jgi:hypothetical protein